MSRTLLARTRPEFYAEWVEQARQCGVAEAAISRIIAVEMAHAQALLKSKCPKCGAPISRYVDYKRQQGPSNVPGMWVQYRCSTQPPPGQRRPDDVCDYAEDLKESEASN